MAIGVALYMTSSSGHLLSAPRLRLYRMCSAQRSRNMLYTLAEIKENRKKWVEALRSGKYKQTEGTLKGKDEEGRDRFCCLGVACDISGLSTWESTKVNGRVYDGNYGVLPDSVQQWLGMDTSKGSYRNQFGDMYSLTQMNDDCLDFDMIADMIEQEPEGLFVRDMIYTLEG